jgi:ribonuclease-3
MNEEALQGRIGYRFNDPDLLHRALTHRSYSAEHNERLEFLGDSVVNCAVALELFERFPELDEGRLSRLRSNMVSQGSLAAIAQEIGLGQVLRLGEGEIKSGGAQRPSLLADALEAVAGAAFLDGGFDATRGIVRGLFEAILADLDPNASGKDAKTLLQEHLQGRRLPLPKYTVVATRGVAHEKEFEVQCVVEEPPVRTTGIGTSRRSAEQAAAQRAYELIVPQ